LVETRKGILSKAKLALRPMTILPSLRGVIRYTSRFAEPPLTPLQLAELEVCLEPHENASSYRKKDIDNAADVIHRT
jgi:hypothetical protein